MFEILTTRRTYGDQLLLEENQQNQMTRMWNLYSDLSTLLCCADLYFNIWKQPTEPARDGDWRYLSTPRNWIQEISEIGRWDRASRLRAEVTCSTHHGNDAWAAWTQRNHDFLRTRYFDKTLATQFQEFYISQCMHAILSYSTMLQTIPWIAATPELVHSCTGTNPCDRFTARTIMNQMSSGYTVRVRAEDVLS